MADSDKIDWKNFDIATEKLEEFAEKAKSGKQSKDANEALGQLFGVTDNPIFQRMNAEQQNHFLQVVAGSGSGAQVAQKLLEGLHLRPPALAPATPAPVFGMSMPGPAGPGMTGGARPQQTPQQYMQPPQQQTGEQWPPPYIPTQTDEDS